jgi:hypothetical protein
MSVTDGRGPLAAGDQEPGRAAETVGDRGGFQACLSQQTPVGGAGVCFALLRPSEHESREQGREGLVHRTVADGGEVADRQELLAAGQTNAQIARSLGVAEGTVRTHLENIYRRLQVSSRAAAITRVFS